MMHLLKIWPRYFAEVENGNKTFEYRHNDRSFQFGDEVCLEEWNPNTEVCIDSTPLGDTYSKGAYTGKKLVFKIGFVLPVSETHVVFSLLPIEVSK